MAPQLTIWLYGRPVAVVTRERKSRLRLSYTAEALDSYPGGTPLLSLALPLTPDRYPNGVTRAFLDGLLPEGEPRAVIADDLGLPPNDVFGLLAALGRDCAGALVIVEEGDSPPPEYTTRAVEPLSGDDLSALVANLHSAPLGVDRNVRLSLAGVQEKLLLVRLPDGDWARPVRGVPSTHILKPEIEGFENTVANEAFCMRTAKHLDLPVAEVDAILVDGSPVLSVERFDRRVDPDETVRRIHQEDLCQAMGLPPKKKYEQDGGPTLARIARILQDVADPESPVALLRAVTLNVALGNCDAHGKNFSLLHTEAGSLRLAPLYDLISTRLYPLDDKLAMYVDSVQKADRVTAVRIVNEAGKWGLSRSVAEEAVFDLLDRLSDAVSAAAGEIDRLPPELPELVTERVERLRGSRG